MAIYPSPDTFTLRACLIDATPEDAQAAENASDLPASSLYVPASHLKALSLDKPLVVGMRGAGKSYWWMQLQKPELLPLIYGAQLTEVEKIECKPGFGKTGNPEDRPDRTIISKLIEKYKPEDIWRAVIGRHVPTINDTIPTQTWEGRIEWMISHVEETQHAFYAYDQKLFAEKRRLVVLFDALDDVADHLSNRKKLLRGLFRVLVDLRTYRALRGKLFIRPDMLSADTTDFPDASKLLSERVDLEWPRADLYSLLWQTLGNNQQFGETFRDWTTTVYGLRWLKDRADVVWQVPSDLKRDESIQRKVFHGLAGEWMGKDARRGFPFTYLPNHLGDAMAKVSPRSFLVAVHKAAEVTRDKYASAEHALHYEAIKSGVQQASVIRVKELQVEYPWVEKVMNQLKGQVNLPCEWSDIQSIWIDQNLIEQLDDNFPWKTQDKRLNDIRAELQEIAIFQNAKDGLRINVPDVFRIGYGLGRKGGIKPVR